MATLNTAILNVPFLLYEVSFIYIHNNIKTTYFQVVFIFNLEKFEFSINLVTRTGFEPMNACVKGMCVKPLHQRANQNGGPEWT